MTEEEKLSAAKKKALRLLAGKDYSKNELIGRLSEDFGEKAAREAAEVMCSYGYIDDERYAEKLAKRYISVKKYGKSRAAAAMRQKGLEEDVIQEALGAYAAGDIVSDIAELLRTKYADRLFADTDDPIEAKKELNKVLAALARRGYGYSEIKSALETVRNELEEEE